MKHSVPMLIGASLLLGFACAYNFDDQNRVLQRTRDMNDLSPLTNDEGKRLRSLIERGRVKVVDPSQTGFPKRLQDAKNSVTRKLKKHGGGKHEDRAARIPRGATTTTRAADNAPKQEKRTKAVATETTRSKPVETSRQKGHHSSHPDEATTPKDTGRKKTKTGRHDPMQSGYPESSYSTNGYPEDGTASMGNTEDYYVGEVKASGSGDGPSGAAGAAGLSYVFMYLEGFQDARNLAPGVPPNSARPDEFSAGTLYLFNNEPVYGVIHDQFSGNSTTGIVVDESDMFAEVTGQCIRTDPYDQLDTQNYVGRAYCQFVYTSTGLVDDVLTAEGPVQIGEDAILPVTGGRGVYRRTVGEMVLTPVDDVALTSTPPSIEFNYDLDLPTSYYIQAYIYMDVNLLPPEVLS